MIFRKHHIIPSFFHSTAFQFYIIQDKTLRFLHSLSAKESHELHRIKNAILLLCIFLFIPDITSTQIKETQISTPVFETLSVENGLPENSVICILQDYLGYLWFGTQNGLARYDGYRMEVFQPFATDLGGKGISMVVAMYEDKDKVLWVATTDGLSRFDRLTESFTSYVYRFDDHNSISSNKVRCIYEDSKERLWVGTQTGLNLFDRSTDTFHRYYFQVRNDSAKVVAMPDSNIISVNAIIEDTVSHDLLIGSETKGLWQFNVDDEIFSKYVFNSHKDQENEIDRIQSLYRARDGKIWMSSYNTLTSLNPNTKECRLHLGSPMRYGDQSYRQPFAHGSVVEDRSGRIWVAFNDKNNGIFSVDQKTGSIKQYDPFDVKERSTYDTRVYSVYEDRFGTLWVGTWLFGVKKWDSGKKQFHILNNVPVVQNGIVTTYTMCYDPGGFLWLSTNRGLIKYELKTGRYTTYLTNHKQITEHTVVAILRDASGYIWLGTKYSGLLRFDPLHETAQYYLNHPGEIPRNPFVFLQDRSGLLWIGTDGFGLYRYNIEKDRLTRFVHSAQDSGSLSQNQPMKLYEDRQGTLWVGTNLGGLNKFDKRTNRFVYCGFRSVIAIYEDTKGNFWIGDYHSGLSLFNRENSTVVRNYSRKEGLMTNAVWGISEDNSGNLWIQTVIGMLKFNPMTERFRLYTIADGLPDNFIKPLLECKDEDGKMFINTQKGSVAFWPDSIRDNPIPPKILITGVSTLNRRNIDTSQSIFATDQSQIIFNYDQHDLRINFVGIHFSEPAKNKYRYILEGYDNEWIDAGYQRTARYTNLEPGTYVFKVTACNRDGVWNPDGASVTIIITPPWWKTSWAYSIYLILFLGIGTATWTLQLRRLRILQKYQMAKFESEKLQEIDEMKSRFFTNISHEFRTPLTLIIGPVKQIAERITDEKIKEWLDVVHKNANKLLWLVNQLLDISKIESGSMKLHASRQDIVRLVKAIVLSFRPYAERKNIDFICNVNESEMYLYVDKEKLETIIVNILSNAFKFTPEGGQIELSIRKEGDVAVVCISDTGIGVPKDKLSKIFDRFYQVEGNHTRSGEGTGIGLALTKELVELHKWTISINSEEGKGTQVTFCIPIGNAYLKHEEIIETEEKKTPVIDNEITPDTHHVIHGKNQYIDLRTELPSSSVLLVEDNADVRNYLKTNLENEYNLLEAIDGEQGWSSAVELLPDIIVSDVMMPRMDGFELCAKLKSDERTSHIPVILLTAKATNQDKIAGFERGADVYIMKPFDPAELKARIRNLIEQRKRMQNHFQKNGFLGIDDSTMISIDKKFLQKVLHIIVDNLSNSLFSVESLAEQSAVSRSVLHKKIVSLTGEPPVELIRRIRLTKAAEMIMKQCGNLSEIALDVGFTNPAYFSECFKKHFGVPPSQYPDKIRTH